MRYALYAATAFVFGSGLAWLASRFVEARRLAEALAALSLRVHGGAAMILLFLIGVVTALHTAKGWRERKNRASGAILSGSLAALTATGYLLYYLGGEWGRAAASIVHWVLGLALPVALVSHILLGRRAL